MCASEDVDSLPLPCESLAKGQFDRGAYSDAISRRYSTASVSAEPMRVSVHISICKKEQ